MSDESSRARARKTPRRWRSVFPNYDGGHRLMQRVQVAIMLGALSLLLLATMAVARATVLHSATPDPVHAFTFASPASTLIPSPTDSPPPATPTSAPTATPEPPQPTPTAIPAAPIASFASLEVARGSNPGTFVLHYTVTTSPAAPGAEFQLWGVICGAPTDSESGILDGNGSLSSDFAFHAPCAPASLSLTFGGAVLGVASVDVPAW